MKKLIPFLTILLFLNTVPLSSLTFKYAFLYQNTDTSVPQAIDFKSISTPLSSGDQLKIYIKPIRNAYIYLFFQDTSDGLYLLFPTMISDFDGFYKFNKNYLIPKGDEWFFLDDESGTEKFYLIASNKRLEKLEELTTTYLEYFYSNTTPDTKLKEARQKVIEEIKTVRLVEGQEKVKEDIVLVACDFRGMGDQYEFNAVEVEVDGFYAKTIRIEH
ncbi:MAG: DUF4384 domain-containing protein [Spirochaetales bacterium]|nr:DUF4384 domain-containing protein [Spirochaetales bacterium]